MILLMNICQSTEPATYSPVQKFVARNISFKAELFNYLGFYIAFNPIQIKSCWVVLWAEET